MDETINDVTELELSTSQNLAKLILATTAGFLASKAAETVFTNVVAYRRAKSG